MRKSSRINLIGVMTVLILALASGSVLAKDDPVTAFKKLGELAGKKDWGGFWDGCEKSTQQTMGKLFLFVVSLGSLDKPDLQAKLQKEFGEINPEAETKITKAQFISLMKLLDEMGKDAGSPEEGFQSDEVVEKERKGDRAILSVKTQKDKPPEDIIMVLEDGAWKFFMPDPFKDMAKDKTEKTPPSAAGPSTPSAPSAPAAPEKEAPEAKAKKALEKYFK
ncbi:MAG: hypothetical protein AB1641_23445 [Thermodesulfobacteriota bacterium]